MKPKLGWNPKRFSGNPQQSKERYTKKQDTEETNIKQIIKWKI